MSWISEVTTRVGQLLRRGAAEERMDEEIRFHLDMEADKNVRAGMRPEEARRRAVIAFGGVETHREELREGRQIPILEDAVRNLRYALRTLWKTPFITGIAVLSLALGIGANSAIYSLFDQILLRRLPVPQPERLFNLTAPGPAYGGTHCGPAGGCDGGIFSYPMFRDLERANAGFTGIAAHRVFVANVSFQGQTLNGEGMLVSGSYFPVLGLRPTLGRLLAPADDETVGGHFVVVLSYDYWESKLSASPGVLNQTLLVNGQPVAIVGVAPKGFQGTTLGVQPMVFVPLTMTGRLAPLMPGMDAFTTERRSYWLSLFGRLEPGVSTEQAQTAINARYRPIIREVEVPLQEGMTPGVLAEFGNKEMLLEGGARGQSRINRDLRTPMILLFAITGMVLLITCANIANLLLARGANRGREMAVRLSLGASRRRVLAQLLTESCVLGLLGGAASLLVAQWTLRLIGSILPPQSAAMLQLGLPWRVVLFAAALSIGTALLFGMFPALHSTRPDLVATIRANTGQIAGARAAVRFRTVLVTAQIALSMVLLISAGLYVRSLWNISRVELGLEVDQVVTFALSPELNGYEPERSKLLFRQLEEELAALPQVTAVTAAMLPILSGGGWTAGVAVEGFRADPEADNGAMTNMVGLGYFAALGVPVLTGREFTLADREGSPTVAVVNESFVKKFGLGRDAIGKRMAAWGNTDLDTEIVGIVADAKVQDVKGESRAAFFTPYRQLPTIGAINFYVRTSGPPEQLIRRIPEVIARFDPQLPVENLKTMPQQIRESVYLDRMISTLSAAFALLATLLAAIGLYGVLAYTVAQRTRELGVRMALGADSRRIRLMVLRQVGRMTLIGGVIGVVAGLGLGRVIQSLLYGLEGNDPAVVAAAVVTLVLTAFGAGYLPARRASTLNPIQALRYE